MAKKKPKPPRIVAKDADLKRAWEAACDIEDEGNRSDAFAAIAGCLLIYEDAKGILWGEKIIDTMVTAPAVRCNAFVSLSGARRTFREQQERERESREHARQLGLTR